ncbi:MAG: dihydrolipoyl dehydrogenase, partial [Pseudomonadota bacterium]
RGWGKITAQGEVTVGDEVHKAKNIVIATGSEVSPLKGVEIDEERVVSSTGALELKKVPGKMVVIGGGVIGLEMGSVYARLGSEVTVVEYLDHITPGMDAEISKQFQKILRKQGITFILEAAVSSVETMKTKAKVHYTSRKDDSANTIDADIVLLATGRRPFTDGLGLAELGVKMNNRGMVETDPHWRTNVDGIYAIGDVIAGPMLAHKAEDEGMAVAETIAGQAGHVNYDVIPGVIYTHPEVANVGKTEEQLKEEGRAYKVGKFPFMGNGRAKAHFAGEGFVKILADKDTDRILGAHVIGPMAGDLIHEVCVAMEFGASAEDLARTCHAHPTFSEAVREAALACGDGAIHA